MQEKLKLARVKGRGGWWNSDECTIDDLRSLLREDCTDSELLLTKLGGELLFAGPPEVPVPVNTAWATARVQRGLWELVLKGMPRVRAGCRWLSTVLGQCGCRAYVDHHLFQGLCSSHRCTQLMEAWDV